VECKGRDSLEIVVFWDFEKISELVIPASVLSVVIKEENKNLNDDI